MFETMILEEMWKLLTCIIVPMLTGAAYLRLARRWNIVDRPNQRSSHRIPVVRGGGVVFPLSWIAFSAVNGFAFPWFTAAVALIATISYIDDLHSLKPGIRTIFQMAAFTLCFQELGLWDRIPAWAVALVYLVGIGALNAINFMDGINGITGMYALSMLVSLMLPLAGFEWGRKDSLTASPIVPMAMAVCVFGWFNFRKRALFFAGDVGSISLGLIMIFLLLLIMTGQEGRILLRIEHRQGFDWKFILFLAVYGVDSVITIMHRILLRENIFMAHRRHLFQFLANEKGLPHLWVSAAYAMLQFFINVMVLMTDITPLLFLLILLSLSLTYLWLKFLPMSDSDRGRAADSGAQSA